MFVDEVVVELQGGKGGNGCVSFRHEKFKPKGGPDGGDGGRGGNVVIKAESSLATLSPLKGKNFLKAEDGRGGGGNLRHGRDGDDLIIKVPLGTEVIDLEKNTKIIDLLKENEERILVRGGRGGRGNAQFATPTKRTPLKREVGREGERGRFRLVLKLVSDAALIGYPNVGKSTLLERLSSARPKIAPYPFTTTHPCLGVMWVDEFTPFTLVDMPALVKGAHEGTGLGNRFLRHILRTHLLIHILDPSTEDPIFQFQALNEELKIYKEELLELPQILVLNKCELIERKRLSKLKDSLASFGYEIILISAIKGEGIPYLKERIRARLKGC
jgi:GTP-binding protein